jgi:2-polyprenyl-6-hydroxyphenyl methylase/3-demethylubiquinone-9 3-methyltransferase
MSRHAEEVAAGKRFQFGKNWSAFLSHLDDERIARAEESLKVMLDRDDLQGQRFLDIGSGSGLFSLAARRLGASVLSFDYDPRSVACAAELKRRYFPDDDEWQVREGSVLDLGFVESLGVFDIVYSWGVLHHTGHMSQALENAAAAVRTVLLLGAGGKGRRRRRHVSCDGRCGICQRCRSAALPLPPLP